jgi:hypothetical protein
MMWAFKTVFTGGAMNFLKPFLLEINKDQINEVTPMASATEDGKSEITSHAGKREKSYRKKLEILAFAREHRRRPRRNKPEEKRLGFMAESYTSPSSRSYDPEFTRRLNELAPVLVHDPSSKKMAILDFVKKHGRRPIQHKPEEKKLGYAARRYTSPTSVSYDPEFTRRLNELDPIIDTADLNKKAVLAFVKANGRRPSRHKPEESKLSLDMGTYKRPSNASYDPEFARELNKLVPARVSDPRSKKAAVLAFVKRHGRRPSKAKAAESKLGTYMYSYCSPTSGSYDPEFTRLLNELAPIIDVTGLNKEAILSFVKEHGRRPSQHKPEERKLGGAARHYTSPDSDSYDVEFSIKLNELAPDKASKMKAAILSFVNVRGRRPNITKPDEKILGRATVKYTSPSNNRYDPDFSRKLNELIPIIDKKGAKKTAILDFVKEHGRRPDITKPEEKKLGAAIYTYTRPYSDCYDQEFTRVLNELAPIIDKKGAKKTAVLNFVKVHGRRPNLKKPEEKKLGIAAASYSSHTSKCYDPEFAAKLKAFLKP